ncbi:MAG: indolepyruvate oxidoreductase subunit beta [Armatimonadota bacterium]|nr:indolepyruvate oxidoreductase subunit beta [Armatimonadota bacterium]
MTDIVNISLVGVGGQGILLASDILCRVALLAGKDVKKSEVHGMAQRGGSVMSQVRIGEKVYSPLIATGKTHILVSFEKLEALRYAHLLTPDGTALVNDQEIKPITVSSGQADWPNDLNERLREATRNLKLIPALDIAQQLGDARVVNLVMLGALSLQMDHDETLWREAITSLVKPRFLELNLKAFEAGRTWRSE